MPKRAIGVVRLHEVTKDRVNGPTPLVRESSKLVLLTPRTASADS